jgi:hypothetical protein
MLLIVFASFVCLLCSEDLYVCIHTLLTLLYFAKLPFVFIQSSCFHATFITALRLFYVLKSFCFLNSGGAPFITYRLITAKSSYPPRKTSTIFSSAELMRMGKGYFSNRRGNLTMASHCKPILLERKPAKQSKKP